jgi:P27 family predicted phage terminase small subunit
MPGGRPPKPTKLKILQGNPGKRALPKNEPQPPASDGEAPDWLEGRPREAWDWLAPMLGDMKVLTEADKHALALLCDVYAEYIALRRVIQNRGRVYTTTTAQGDTMIRPRPEVAMISDAWRRIHRMMVEFGMTPSARSKVTRLPEEEKDPFADYLKGKNG